MTQPASISVLVLVRDLMFSGRILAEARAAGTAIKNMRDPAQLSQSNFPADLMLVDLNLDGAIEAASQWSQTTGKPVIGFVSHVDSSTIARAKEVGITRIMPRSRFVQLLPTLIRGQL